MKSEKLNSFTLFSRNESEIEMARDREQEAKWKLFSIILEKRETRWWLHSAQQCVREWCAGPSSTQLTIYMGAAVISIIIIKSSSSSDFGRPWTPGQLRAYPWRLGGMTAQTCCMGGQWHQNWAHPSLQLLFRWDTEIDEKVIFWSNALFQNFRSIGPL